jgi:hypothetical protein
MAWFVAAALAGNAGWHLAPALTQMFPREFKRLGKARLTTAPPAEPGRTYYRFVNVDHYLLEAETLPFPPEATLLVRHHPYEFAPYLYEGLTARERARRRTLDQRMRLVLVRQPDDLRPQGEAYGMISMQVRFAANRGGMAEPLLSLGPRDVGELFYVRYLNGRDMVLGFESMAFAVLNSQPIPYEPGREYRLELFCGSMLAPANPTPTGRERAERLYYSNLVSIRCDGRELLNQLVTPHAIRADDVYAGANVVQADSAGSVFSGQIEAVRRGGLPPLPAGGLGDADFGAVRLVTWLPAAAAGIPEPLVVVGESGAATLGYVRVLPGGRAKLGAEFWGVGAFESEVVDIPSDTSTEFVFEFPALFPPVGDPRWGAVPREKQQMLRSHLTIRVNGRVVMEREVKDTGAPSRPVAFGRNPAGGSWVTSAFSGRLVQGMRLPLAGPAQP